MPKLFLSYARDSAPAIQTLIGHLDQLGNAIWVDRRLRGGQHWWDEILREIAECDVFIAAVSRTALRSVACARERAWAELLGKHILPVAVERLPRDLPGEFAGTQIIDYSTPEVEAVLALAASLTSLPPPRPLPDPLPPAPPAPLSHMTELTDKASSSGSLTQHEQREIVTHLEDALRSTDPEERQSGRNILQRLASRGDLYADVYRRLVQLQRDYGSSIPAPPAPQPASGSTLTIDRVAAAQKRSSTSQAFDLLREKHRDYIETLLGKHLVNILHVIGEVLMEPDVTKRRQLASNARRRLSV